MECVPFALVRISSVCVCVMRGNVKVLCDRGMRCVSMCMGLSVSVLNVFLMRVILLM